MPLVYPKQVGDGCGNLRLPALLHEHCNNDPGSQIIHVHNKPVCREFDEISDLANERFDETKPPFPREGEQSAMNLE
jgi:hypothetical protein